MGIEGDFNWASLDANVQTTNVVPSVPFPPGSLNVQMSQNLDWLASVRGRVGYVWGQSLWYATGGAAWEGVEYAGAFTVPISTASTPNPITKTNSGWVAGGGVEYMATEHVLLRLEYLYYGFKSFTAVGPGCNIGGPCFPGVFSTFSWSDNNVQTVRAAVSYKF
jgi:outer membrane immunogenic protein